MEIDRIDVSKLDVPVRTADLRRDLHVFVDYVRDRDVKRGHRDNLLNKADAKRLAKLLSYKPPPEEQKADEYSAWMGFVDNTALRLGFVQYDTEGDYAGYTSYSKSYPENYIEFSAENYQRFLTMKAGKQEATLLGVLLTQQQGCESEFYSLSPLGRLDRFDRQGCASGVMPLLDFAAIRRFVLELLAKCPTGQWLSTASLVRYLKQNHRYFLIPQKLLKDKWGNRPARYGNFSESESKSEWGKTIPIAASDEDAFERVEGRYVERFLEGIPLSLGYVDVAYSQKTLQTLHPSRGCLKAFRVSDRLRRALEGAIQEPRVTVTPSFELYVQGETYPAGVLAELRPLCELVAEGTSIVLKLNKQQVAAARAADPKLDVVALLRQRAGGELPANVVRELSEWAQHGEKFVLYADCCVLEADAGVTAADPFTIERLAPGIRLVHSPGKLFDQLERQELMPLHVKHGEQALTPLPRSARTRFPKKSARQNEPRPAKRAVTLMRVTRIQLVCPDREFLDRLCRVLADAKCPAEADRRNLTLAYTKQHEPAVTGALKTLGKEYQIKIEDAGVADRIPHPTNALGDVGR